MYQSKEREGGEMERSGDEGKGERVCVKGKKNMRGRVRV